MKKVTTLFTLALGLCLTAQAQYRYNTEVFNDSEINVTKDVVYGANFNPYLDPALVGGQTQVQPLMLDVYAPDFTVDSDSNRPVVLFLHTGSFLPPSVTNGCTGTKEDSVAVALCRRFARHGFVAVSMTYRLGWLANSTDLDIRRGTNLLAVYYAIQDAKTAVRYLYASKLGLGNLYGIDPSKIILLGSGSGGYTTFGYTTIDNLAEVTTPTKFQYQGTTGILGQPVNAGDSYIDTTIFGDWDGFGGAATVIGQNPAGLPIIDTAQPGRNIVNHAGLPNDVLMAVNMGGAMGDSAWIEAGDVPMISLHAAKDFFAPYEKGMVQVPVGQQFFPVVYVSGSHWVISRANALGNNNIFLNANYTDALWQKGINNKYNTNQAPGIYTLNVEPDDATTPWVINSAPWDFWDPASTCVNAGNPNDIAASKSYIDTAFNYMLPRMLTVLEDAGLPIGIEENKLTNSEVKIYPNPANGQFVVELNKEGAEIESIEVMDITGKMIYSNSSKNTQTHISTNGWSTGLYIVRVNTNKGTSIQRVAIK